MRLFSYWDYDHRLKRRDKRRARQALREYARNGWQSPWVRVNSFWQALRR